MNLIETTVIEQELKDISMIFKDDTAIGLVWKVLVNMVVVWKGHRKYQKLFSSLHTSHT